MTPSVHSLVRSHATVSEAWHLVDLPDLLTRTDGFLWLDIPTWNEQALDVWPSSFAAR